MSVGATLWEAAELVARMTWETWWALVLGFALSGTVETFVSEERMSDVLGGDGWREVGLGIAFGTASSSCSYAAVGTSRTLFRKGASGVASLGAFLFASTDLVIELGLVIWTLLGWQFVVGEYVGGVVAVLAVALLFKRVVPRRWFDDARERLREERSRQCTACGMEIDPGDAETLETVGGTKRFCCSGCLRAYRGRSDVEGDASLTEKLLTTDGWRAACRNGLKEWEMLWGDVAVGFLLAGLVAAFVPDVWWTALFDAGGGASGLVRNAVLAVAVGVVTFMCSVGNVPFALVLWMNGLPFGAVLAFIYADLVVPPLVNAYRRYYGPRVAAAMFVGFAGAAVVAGTLTDLLFGALGLIPPRTGAGGTALGDGYTTWLNAAFTLLFATQVVVAYGAENVELRIRALPDAARRRWRTAVATARRVERWTYRTALGFGDAVVHLTLSLRAGAAALGRLAVALGRLVRRAVAFLR